MHHSPKGDYRITKNSKAQNSRGKSGMVFKIQKRTFRASLVKGEYHNSSDLIMDVQKYRQIQIQKVKHESEKIQRIVIDKYWFENPNSAWRALTVKSDFPSIVHLNGFSLTIKKDGLFLKMTVNDIRDGVYLLFEIDALAQKRNTKNSEIMQIIASRGV